MMRQEQECEVMKVKKHISLYHSNVYAVIIKYVYYLKYIYSNLYY